ncbi:MAG: MFS transporter [Actinomycetales bacterium]|nr:MFS transporter [Actinomycetales bacterium]
MSQKPSRPVGLVIATLALSGAVVSLMQTLLVPIIPDIPNLLGVTVDDASWLITATLLASAVATPSLSKLADMFGKRRMMIVSLLMMIAGSVLGALSLSLPLLITARALQGFSMALIPIGISIMRDEIPREKLVFSVALMSATMGIGAAIGLPVGGLIYSTLGWHGIFWVPAVIAVMMLVAIVVVIPESSIVSGGIFDFGGGLLLSGALLSLLIAVTKGSTWGWTSLTTVGTFALSAGLVACWVPWELRSRDPLVDLRTSALRPVLLTNIASLLVGFAMYANMISTTQLLQVPKSSRYGFGLTVLEAGMALLPAALMMVIAAPISARITSRFGAKTALIFGALILGLGYTGRSLFISSEWEIIVGAMVISMGTAVAYAAMPTIIMSAVPITETAAANGFNTVVRTIGTATSSAVIATTLTGTTFLVGGTLFPQLFAFQEIFIGAGVASFLGAIVAAWLPKRNAA